MADETKTIELADVLSGVDAVDTIAGTENVVVSDNGTLKSVTTQKIIDAAVEAVPEATTDAAGLLSAADKAKLDALVAAAGI